MFRGFSRASGEDGDRARHAALRGQALTERGGPPACFHNHLSAASTWTRGATAGWRPPAVPTGLLKVGQDSLDLAGCLYDVYIPSPVRRPELVFTDSAHHRAPVNLLLICLQESSESLRKVNPAPAQAFYHAFLLLCMTQLNHLLCVPPQSALVSGAVCSHSALSPSKSERA